MLNPRKIFHYMNVVLCFLFSYFFARFFYHKKYIRGKHFAKINSMGWRWVARDFLFQKILGINGEVPWPVSPFSTVGDFRNITFEANDLNNFQGNGCYFQAMDAEIKIGDGCYIGPNVGIINSNHSLDDIEKHEEGKNVVLGKKCWIGMNSVILPGVVLGENTVVGAGSIVTKSFPKGYCVIAGNPAKVIKELK